MFKLLLIASNKQYNNLNHKHDEYDIFTNCEAKTVNDIYYDCYKNYWYYIFLDSNIPYIDQELIDKILVDIKKYKPAILQINDYIKVYHRSVIHFIYPLYKIERYRSSLIYIINALEYPLRKYRYVYNHSNLKHISIDNELFNWFKKAFKKRELLDVDRVLNSSGLEEYNLENVVGYDIEKINFLEMFHINEYFDIEHPFFRNKMIKFHKNDREIYGQCGMYHFAHDFRTANRNNIINHLVKLYDYEKYLEVGTATCDNLNDVLVDDKTGVDPFPNPKYPMVKKWYNNLIQLKSSDYFDQLEPEVMFDIMFIDGCLLEGNLKNDIEQALKHLYPWGTILVHDCNPPNEYYQRDWEMYRCCYNRQQKIIWNNMSYNQNWNGKAWKVIAKLIRERDDLRIYTIDTDWGIGMIQYGEPFRQQVDVPDHELYKYSTMMMYRKYVLNLISVEDFLDMFKFRTLT